MKKQVAKASEQQQFWTFLIKKDRTGKVGLWFVLVFIPSMHNFSVLNPVWKKIQKNGLPKDLGNHGPFVLGGDIKLLGTSDAGANELKFIKRIMEGFTYASIPAGTHAFRNREELFFFMMSATEETDV